MLQTDAIRTIFIISGQVGNFLISVTFIKATRGIVFDAHFKANAKTASFDGKVFHPGQKLRTQTDAPPVFGNGQ